MREIEQIKNATVGKETREPIARTLEKIASNFNNGQNTNQEVVEARGTHSTLNARLNVIESNIGDLSKLKTKNKSSIEGALNELAKRLGLEITQTEPVQEQALLPVSIYRNSLIVKDENLYTVHGYDGKNPYSNIYEYDREYNTWDIISNTVLGSIDLTRGIYNSGYCSFKHNGKDGFAIIGGYSSNNGGYQPRYVYNGNELHEFWENGTRYNCGGIACVYCRGKIYMFGGYSYPTERFIGESFVYDISTKSVNPIASVPNYNSYLRCTEINGKIYVYNGNNFYEYNPTTNLYVELSPAPVCINMSILTSYGKYVLLMGSNGNGDNKVIYWYDTELNVWIEKSSLTDAIYWGSYVKDNGNNIWICGGRLNGSSTPSNKLIKYMPYFDK